MKCQWIVENFSEGDDIFELINEIKDKEYPLTLINRKNGFEYKQIQFDNECVVFYGSINMAKIIKKHLSTCAPVVWDSDRFECVNYWNAYKTLLFNDKYEFTTLGNLKEYKFEFYSKFAKEGLIFIRPSAGDKIFSGQLLDIHDFDKFFSGQSNLSSAIDTDVVVISTPKNITAEYRYVVTDEKKILGKSCYKFQNKITSIPSAPRGATELVEKTLDVGVFPANVFSIDIAQDSDGIFWIMEFNSFNSCGLYSTDKKSIVEGVSNIAIRDFNNK